MASTDSPNGPGSARSIRVLVCDDQDVIREGLGTILGAAVGLQVVATASDGAEALARIPEAQPDVVLMDLKMPGVNGVQATRQIRERYPRVKVLVLTTYDADEWVYDAIRGGACGYLLKDSPSEQLVEAIRGTAAGKSYVDPAVAGKLLSHVASEPGGPRPTLPPDISAREREILSLLAQGLGNGAIAKKLFLSEGTIRNYMTSIFAKLGVTDRTQAAVIALRLGLGLPQPPR